MATAALTGTVVSTMVRTADIVAGGKTIILTLTGDTWVASGATFDAQRQNIINGLVSAQSEAHGWNVEVKGKIAVTDVVRTSSTVVTITLDAEASYSVTNFTGTETITATIPSTAVVGAAAIVASPTFTVSPTNVNWYVSPSGSDSNNGLSPDATTANTSKPFLTIGKTMNTGARTLPGDKIYVGPGYYYSTATITPLATLSSAGTPTRWIGDPTNKQGFKDSSGVALAAGLPWITTRTAAEGLDSPIASTGNLFQSSTNNPSGVQLSFLVLEVGIATVWNFSLAAGSDNSFEDCRLIGSIVFGSAAATNAATAGRNLTLRRCTVINASAWNSAQTVAAATADADLNVLIEECKFYGGGISGSSLVALSASGGNLAGGIRVKNCTFAGRSSSILSTTASRVSTVTPIRFSGCLIIGTTSAFGGGTAGQIVDDGYNRIISPASAASNYTNVTQAGTSVVGVAPNLVLDDVIKFGLEMPRADFMGWTDSAHTNQKFSASGSTTPDFRGRTARPWGAGASIGCFQAQAVSQDTGSAITGGGANSLKITGAGEVSFFVPVDASATTISVRTKSSSYGGTNYPQLIVVADGNLGIASDQTVTAVDANEATITSPSFTPTAKGVVEVRLVSRSTSTTSSTWFDLLASP